MLLVQILSGRGVQQFSPGPSVSSTNKTDRDDIVEILLKVALNTINQQKGKEGHVFPGKTKIFLS
jgi:hypothetical protein